MRKDYWKTLEAAFERLVGGEGSDSHPLDILHQVLDELESRVLTFKGSLAPARLLVRIYARDERQLGLYRRAYVEEPHLMEAMKQTLEELGVSRRKHPEIEILIEIPEVWIQGRRLVMEEVWPAGRPAVQADGRGRLRVEQGNADVNPLEIQKERILIGRQPDVYNQQGQPIRHNDLAFDEGDEAGRTVSRAHAHLEFDAQKKLYRLFHDEGSSTTGVFREGRLINISHNPRGLLLMSGDVLCFGKARVRFEVEE